MKHVQENLEQYRDHKFFYGLKEEFEFGKKTTDKKKGEEDDKDSKPKPKAKAKDPKVAQEEKIAIEDSKNALLVVKKARDNFGQFIKASKDNIALFKKFWSRQQKALVGIQAKDRSVKAVYALHDSDFIVLLKNVEGIISLVVIKTHLGEGEKNPFFVASVDEANNDFKVFLGEMKKSLLDAKNSYIQNTENKLKDEKQKAKSEKLGKFLKESDES